jgi:hypothetical protein
VSRLTKKQRFARGYNAQENRENNERQRGQSPAWLLGFRLTRALDRRGFDTWAYDIEREYMRACWRLNAQRPDRLAARAESRAQLAPLHPVVCT